MNLNLNVIISDSTINIKSEEISIVIIRTNNININNNINSMNFLFLKGALKNIFTNNDIIEATNSEFDTLVNITISDICNYNYLAALFNNLIIENEIKFDEEELIGKEEKNKIIDYKNTILFILENFGYTFSKEKLASTIEINTQKTRHKWRKELSTIEFIAHSKDADGIAIWKSKNNLVLLAGAKLNPNPQLNKDGSLNFSAKFAEKLRLDLSDKIVNNTTISDISFPSPNQLGLFLFFGGQNTWAELKDKSGKSLDDLSKI